jgi:neutral ceramidase
VDAGITIVELAARAEGETKVTRLSAGAGVSDISPADSQYLFGYPHVDRFSAGINDPLLSSALFLTDGLTSLLFIANDIIFVSKATAARVRGRIREATRIPEENILISATHTHSGPSTVDYASLAADPTVPKVDQRYLARFENGIVGAATAAYRSARPAELGLAVTEARVGTNRRDPEGPADPQVPVLMVREAGAGKPIACMLVVSMHPTVLREDSRVVSGDFPGLARRYLQRHVLGVDCAVLHHTGPAGNQSPRHVVRENTIVEAQRLGEVLGQAVARILPKITYIQDLTLQSRRALIDLPRRAFAPPEAAQDKVARAAQRLEQLRQNGAPRQAIRGAEVDWFGAEETARLALSAGDGSLAAYYDACLPAEVQALQVGPWAFVGWPGEVFVEYGLQVKRERRGTFVISLANGELQGYITTEQAATEGGYEASNAIFAPQSGQVLVETTLRLLA